MQLYAPTSTTATRKRTRAPALGKLDGARIGILENGKLNAEEMLNEVAQLFVQRHGCTVGEARLQEERQRAGARQHADDGRAGGRLFDHRLGD
jgi:hypothetical protein